MCKEVPLRATEAMAVELGVCGFYFKPFENKLLYQCRPPPPPVSLPNQIPHIQHKYPKKIYTSWAGQELFDMVILPCCAEFYEFGLQNLTRDLERTHRGNQRHPSNLIMFSPTYLRFSSLVIS